MNALRPVALASALMKVLVSDFLDPWQLAYRRNRNVEDAVLSVLNSIYSHKPGTLFGSCALTLPALVIQYNHRETFKGEISIPDVLWVYLTNRPQFVKVSPDVIYSKSIRTNTGAPQGTVLSTLLTGAIKITCN